VPFNDVANRLLPALATVTNNRRSGDQHIDRHAWVASIVLVVQVTPSGEVIERLVPLFATATNRESSGAQHTDDQVDPLAEGVLAVHVIPSGDVAITLFPQATNRDN
jgi:hypothetical protein